MQTVMAMSPDEKLQFNRLAEEVEEYKERVEVIDKKINSILTLVRGIAIGLAIGGFMFGVIKFPDLIKFFTK